MQGGKSLAEALAAQKVFPPIFVNMIRAGETGGFLETRSSAWRSTSTARRRSATT